MVDSRDTLLAQARDTKLNPLDRGAALHRLREATNWTQGHLAEEAGFSSRLVRELLSLNDLPACTQTGLRTGYLSLSHVRVLRKLTPQEQAHWCQVVQDEALSAAALERRVAARQGRPDGAAKARQDAGEVSPAAAAPPALTAAAANEAPPAKEPAYPGTASETPLSPREERRLAQVLVAYPYLPHPSAESMVRFIDQSPFGQEILNPLQHALDHLPDDLSTLTGSQAMTLVATLTPLIDGLAAVRAAAQTQLGGNT